MVESINFQCIKVKIARYQKRYPGRQLKRDFGVYKIKCGIVTAANIQWLLSTSRLIQQQIN